MKDLRGIVYENYMHIYEALKLAKEGRNNESIARLTKALEEQLVYAKANGLNVPTDVLGGCCGCGGCKNT